MSNHVTLNITGMKCAGCVSAVETALKEVVAVDGVNVSLENKEAVVSGSTDVAALIAAVEKAGFTAELAV
ncbi:MAG: cation transporter [Gammaproteobacteria bacterium]|nr:cation transporter [Gammaproteobacteria bacterium]